MRAFYAKAMADEKIGWIFTDVAELDLEAHVPKITAFWATNLLGAKSYSGGAFGVHGRLHQTAPGGLQKEHFERWLVLWCQTVDEFYDGRSPPPPRCTRCASATPSTVASRCIQSPTRRPGPPPDL